MTTKEETCAERIADQMQSREDYLNKLYEIADAGEETFSGDYGTFAGDYPDAPEELNSEQAQERIDELPLGVSVEHVLRIELSTGGPADYITAKLDRTDYGWAVASAQYHFADWGDHAQRTIEEDSPLWRLAESYAEIVTED